MGWFDISIIKFKFEPRGKNAPYFEELYIGYEVKLWNRPGTNYINVYDKGTVSGDGFMGWFESKYLVSEYFSKNKKLTALIKTLDADDKTIGLEFIDIEKSKNLTNNEDNFDLSSFVIFLIVLAVIYIIYLYNKY